MSKIKILAVAPDNHGVGKYRILDPFKFLGQNYSEYLHVDIVFDCPFDDKFFKDYHIVYFHSFIHKLPLEKNIERINKLKSEGIITIMDIDDFWSVDQTHPMFNKLKLNKLAQTKTTFLKSVDHVVCTTKFFAEQIHKKLNLKNVHVFSNAIDPNEPQFIPNKKESDLTRFGWLGGSSHLADLELMKGGIADVITTEKGRYQFVLCGFDTRGIMTETNKNTGEVVERPIRPEETIWFNYEKIFTNNYKNLDEHYKNYLNKFTQHIQYNDINEPYRRIWTKDINKYALGYDEFDVSLIPLQDTLFKNCKSELKIIESGFKRKASIVSYVQPYSDLIVTAFSQGAHNYSGNCLTVTHNKNHKDWGKHMKRLINNNNLITDLGEKLYETVKDSYSLDYVSKLRFEFFKSLV